MYGGRLRALALSAAVAVGIATLSPGAGALGTSADRPLPAEPGPHGAEPTPPFPAATKKPAYPSLIGGLSAYAEQPAGDAPASVVARNEQTAGIAVSIRFDPADGAAPAEIRALPGVVVASEAAGVFDAYADPSGLRLLAENPHVQAVRPLVHPRENAVTSEATGRTVHNSQAWNAFGIDGTGIRVGIIDSFDGYSRLIGSELPAPAAVRCYTDIGQWSANFAACQNEGSTHGTAVAEALVDVAPGVALYLADAPSCGVDLVETVSWMAAQGVDVINYSIGCPWEGPGDGTSPWPVGSLAAVEVAAAANIVWVNAAGNSAKESWSGAFSDTNRDGWLSFGAVCGEQGQSFFLSPGDVVLVWLRWDDSWTAAARDLDVGIFDWIAGDWVGMGGFDFQSGEPGQVPLELVLYEATHPGLFSVGVLQSSGTTPAWVDVQTWGADLKCPVAAHSVATPAESANPALLAAGAASWQTPTLIELFSSQGPTRDGRPKPDLVGADRANSVTYGPLGFSGTSQAAPHVAGLAALVRQAYPTDSAPEVAGRLKSWALPRLTVPNTTWGYGFATLPTLKARAEFAQYPADGEAGEPFPVQPVVRLKNAAGQVLTADSTTSITLSLDGGPGTLTCAGGLTTKVKAGVATFSGCALSSTRTGARLVATPGCECVNAATPPFDVHGDVPPPPPPKVPKPANGPLPSGSESLQLAVMNAGTAASDVSVDFLRYDGSLVPEASTALKGLLPGGAGLVSTTSGKGLPAPFDGFLRPQASVDLAGVLSREISSPAPGGHSYSAFTLREHGSPLVAMPILLADFGPLHWNSRITIRNVGQDLACLRANYYIARSSVAPVGQKIVDAPSGQEGCPTGYRLPGGAQLVLGGGPLADYPFPAAVLDSQAGGLLEVLNANGRNDVVAVVDLYRSDGNRLFGSYDGLASRPSDPAHDDVGTDVVVPLAIKYSSGWYSVIGAQNLGSVPADVNIRYIGTTNGGQPVDVTVTLPQVATVGFHSTYDESTPIPLNFVGYAVVTSTQPVAALVVRGKQTTYQSGINEATYTAANGVPRDRGETTWFMSLIYRRFQKVTTAAIGWNSWIQVQVADGGTATVTLRFVGIAGKGCPVGPFETTTVITGSRVFYMNADADNGFPAGQMPACFVGSASVVGTRPLIVVANISSDSFPGGDNEALYNAVPKSGTVSPDGLSAP